MNLTQGPLIPKMYSTLTCYHWIWSPRDFWFSSGCHQGFKKKQIILHLLSDSFPNLSWNTPSVSGRVAGLSPEAKLGLWCIGRTFGGLGLVGSGWVGICAQRCKWRSLRHLVKHRTWLTIRIAPLEILPEPFQNYIWPLQSLTFREFQLRSNSTRLSFCPLNAEFKFTWIPTIRRKCKVRRNQ